MFKFVFREFSLYSKQLSLVCLLWLVSANSTKTLVWKTWIWCQIMTSQTTHTKYEWHHTPMNETPMKLFYVRHCRTPWFIIISDYKKKYKQPGMISPAEIHLRVFLNQSELQLINVYLPYCSRANTDDLLAYLGIMKQLCDELQCPNICFVWNVNARVTNTFGGY